MKVVGQKYVENQETKKQDGEKITGEKDQRDLKRWGRENPRKLLDQSSY